ncbi:MAG: flavodoxin family protein [Clostridiales bacterium]|jgi:multimeric flavodoxin WrbA|nr:flavodoxin family protein [Clostridiales bacterium]
MNILILIGSPRANGSTEVMANTFRRGAEERGNKIAVIKAYDAKVAPCIDCGRCKDKIGSCIHRDDMSGGLMRLIDDTDMLVIASPVYWWGFPAPLKLIIDRLYAKERKSFKVSSSALLMNAYDEDAFEPAVGQYIRICEHLNWGIAGIITIGGIREKGGVKKSERLGEVYTLGKSIRP